MTFVTYFDFGFRKSDITAANFNYCLNWDLNYYFTHEFSRFVNILVILNIFSNHLNEMLKKFPAT